MQNFKHRLFLFLKSFCQIQLNKSARRVGALGHLSPNQPPHLRDGNTAVEGGGGTSLRSQSCGSRAPDCSQAPSCPVTVGPESCSHLSPANLQPAAFTRGLRTPQPSSQPAAGASHQIGRCRAGAGLPHQCPNADPSSTGSDNKALGNGMAPSGSVPLSPARGKINTN